MRDTVTPDEPAIHLDGVSKVFGKAGSAYRAVDGLNLGVRPGEMLALLGKTGCGKSTIFNMIAGLTEPTSGTIRVSGRDPFADFDSFRGKMAIVFRTIGCCPGVPRSRTSNSDWRCWKCRPWSGGRVRNYG